MSMVLIDVDELQQMIASVVNATVEQVVASSLHSFPPLLDKTLLMKFLSIGPTKASELLNRDDFPVIREFGHPRVPLHSLLTWIDDHTEWIRDNAKSYHSRRGRK